MCSPALIVYTYKTATASEFNKPCCLKPCSFRFAFRPCYSKANDCDMIKLVVQYCTTLLMSPPGGSAVPEAGNRCACHSMLMSDDPNNYCVAAYNHHDCHTVWQQMI